MSTKQHINTQTTFFSQNVPGTTCNIKKPNYWYVKAKWGFGDHIQTVYFNYNNFMYTEQMVLTLGYSLLQLQYGF